MTEPLDLAPSLRARLLDAALREGLTLDQAETRARAAMAWVERGDAPLMIEGPKREAKPAVAERAAPRPAAAPAPKPARAEPVAAAPKPATPPPVAKTAPTPAPNTAATPAKPWAEQDGELRRLVKEGLTNKQIGQRLGRSEGAVSVRLANLGIKRGNVSDQPGAPPAQRTGDDDPVKFLRSRDYSVTVLPNNRYLLDGREVDHAGLIAAANRNARQLGRPEFPA